MKKSEPAARKQRDVNAQKESIAGKQTFAGGKLFFSTIL